jgi:hypothetical protein
MTVNFFLGFAVNLASRLVTITRMPGALDPDSGLGIVPAYQQSLPANTEKLTVQDLPDNQMLQISVVDTLATASQQTPVVLGAKQLAFNTGINLNTKLPNLVGGVKSAESSLQILTMIPDLNFSGGSNTGSAVGSNP